MRGGPNGNLQTFVSVGAYLYSFLSCLGQRLFKLLKTQWKEWKCTQNHFTHTQWTLILKNMTQRRTLFLADWDLMPRVLWRASLSSSALVWYLASFPIVIERRDWGLPFFKKASHAHPVDHILLSYSNYFMHIINILFLSKTFGTLQSMRSICYQRDDAYNMWVLI